MATIESNTNPSVLLEQPAHDTFPQSRPNSAVIRSVVNDEGLPEVVISNPTARQIEYYDAPIPVDSETDKRFNEAPIPIGVLEDSAPPLPARKSVSQYPYSPGSYGQPQMQPQPQLHQHQQRHQPPYNQGGYAPQRPLQHPSNGSFTPQPQSFNNNQVMAYVTPLHELGDYPKFVDCPFCRHRAETRVKKASSKITHASATVLGFTTIAGAVVPYAGKWATHTVHYCTNCDRKVAMRKWGSREMKAMGTPEHMREVSRYPSAGS